MPQGRNNRGTSRGNRNQSINVKEDHQVHYWTKELRVDQRTLTGAVKAVGPSVEKVREYLRMHETLARHGDLG
jgi:hypothetical protein